MHAVIRRAVRVLIVLSVIMPGGMLRAQEARAAGLDLIGIFHSHPDCDAYFSKTDLENSCPWYSFVVLSVKGGKLEVSKTPNGESPLVHSASPILGVDVWEHSYYIDYRNRRPDYLKAFVDHLVNWDYVLEMYEAATK